MEAKTNTAMPIKTQNTHQYTPVQTRETMSDLKVPIAKKKHKINMVTHAQNVYAADKARKKTLVPMTKYTKL